MNQRATINCLFFLLCGAVAGVQSGCEDAENAENMDAPVAETLALVPTEVWLDDEMATSDHFYNSTPDFKLYAELKTIQAPLELHYNSQNSIFAAEVLADNAPNHVFFFQNKRIVYSEHTGDSGELWKVAYANNTAYAAATRSEGSTWKSMDHHR
ncbi:MAG: hypothetical protein LC664_08165, partial [Flavobacteriales bacterium]|nr:hypothetical protein [Flavobacteriales bacterium]